MALSREIDSFCHKKTAAITKMQLQQTSVLISTDSEYLSLMSDQGIQRFNPNKRGHISRGEMFGWFDWK